MDEELYEPNPFKVLIDYFISNIRTVDETLSIAILGAYEELDEVKREMDEFINTHTKENPEKENEILVPVEKISAFERFLKKRRIYDLAPITIPRIFLVALISHFEDFLRRIISIAFEVKPEITKRFENKQVTLGDLKKFGSVDRTIDYIHEKVIDNLLREPGDQFEKLEDIFNMRLEPKPGNWKKYIEIKARRNLFVHTGGLVSTQYLDTCKENDIDVDDLEVGQGLFVDPDYFQDAYLVIFQIGYKLAQVVWRKFDPDNIELADSNLIQVGYDALYDGNYKLAQIIFDFALEDLPKISDEQNRRIMVINRAQSYKWATDEEKAMEIIDGEDWSSVEKKFQLARAVLLDKFDDAVRIMKEIGDSDTTLSRTAYQEWPLFQEFRKTQQFINAYEDIYCEPFSHKDIEEQRDR